ncbi:MAG TPA: UDP-N-acetylmuramoyl-tripeptide--D-alanyl-D-alanine ligase, partial [Candidatus Eisenbacteria bacterium]|nr:UDP-N-acetylmuramoyl-tripeptide--D-alanyl-D-alanine ligase [Candidatus Eisenbacteria bacterium]
PQHEVLVLELGTNHPGEIERLGSIAEPQIGIITQIGLSHLEGLKSLEGVRTEKLSLLKTVERGGLIGLNGQDPLLADVKSGVHKIVRAGFSESDELSAKQIWCHEKGLSFHLDRFLDQTRGETTLFETQLIGRHNVLACLYAVMVGSALGVDFPLIQKGVASFRPVPGRLVLKTIEGVHFIDDTYNSNPTSFRAALDTLKEFKIRERKGVVCGDMLELGDRAEELHRQMGASIAALLFDYVIATGPLSRFLVDEALKNGFDPTRIRHAKDAAEAGRFLRETATPGDMVLVKGSRGTKMETVFECFTTSSTR